jgi:hypothetical protein
LSTILKNIDDQGLKEGEWKKAIRPALVKGKYMALAALDRPENEAPWPAPGSEDTRFGVTMGSEVGHGAAEVYAGVQA